MGIKTAFVILALVSTAIFGYCMREAYNGMKEYRELREQEAYILNFQDRILNLNAWLSKSSKSADLLGRAQAVRDQYVEVQKTTSRWGLYGGAAMMGLILFAVLLRRETALRILALIIASICCLVAGLFLPLLELSAFIRDLEIPMNIEDTGLLKMLLGESKSFPGDTYFYYQSKSIQEIIRLLLEQKNWVVGLALLAFSVLIPLVKLLSSAVILFKPPSKGITTAERLILALGKWSMADVFVTAIFLASLAFNNLNPGVQIHSQTLLGIYFFFAYCVLSIASSSWIAYRYRPGFPPQEQSNTLGSSPTSMI